MSDLIRVDYTSYDTMSGALAAGALRASEHIAELKANNVANLNAGNWEGDDQGSYQELHSRCLMANQNLVDVIAKAGVKIQTAAGFHQAGQAQAATLYF
ncbi:hypothetical protein TSST111916_15685 [Tsukamurella strandjordii]|uniref:hypothetical protein n=1 Tax=Tsukamurella TaxID=2060 RepID=UPI001C7D8D28|nr:hypothetical protein [Tsukamurella sp. TY48]GIZ96938.1 hypothetical protein TTY48_15500 [Tsukamurella sp. TY48]